MTPCGHCELCIGKTTLPADCATDGGTPYTCPGGYDGVRAVRHRSRAVPERTRAA